MTDSLPEWTVMAGAAATSRTTGTAGTGRETASPRCWAVVTAEADRLTSVLVWPAPSVVTLVTVPSFWVVVATLEPSGSCSTVVDAPLSDSPELPLELSLELSSEPPELPELPPELSPELSSEPPVEPVAGIRSV